MVPVTLVPATMETSVKVLGHEMTFH
jgi:hypothetical protein